MGLYDQRPCPCGSGKMSWWETDARGIPLCRVCDKCRKEKLSKYRPEVLNGTDKVYTDGCNEFGERIEPLD